MGQQAPDHSICPACGEQTRKLAGLPYVKIQWNKTPIDRCKDAWSGTGLEDSDGINPMQFKAEDGKLQIDMGKVTTVGKNSTVRA
jgi:hypothetical protein